MIEIWKAIVGYPHYEVSNIGRVRSSKSGKLKLLKPAEKRDRHRKKPTYLRVCLRSPTGETKNKRIHRLVLEAFVGPAPSGKPYGCHIDGNSMNNWLPNLKWASAVSNEADKELHGTKLIGTSIANSKLNPAAVRRIRRSNTADPTVFKKLMSDLGVARSTILDVLKGRTWSHIV